MGRPLVISAHRFLARRIRLRDGPFLLPRRIAKSSCRCFSRSDARKRSRFLRNEFANIREDRMKRRKKRVLDAGKEARRAARNSGIAPAATRVIADKRKRPARHKKTWLEKETE